MGRCLWWMGVGLSVLLSACSSHPVKAPVSGRDDVTSATSLKPLVQAVQPSCHPEPLTGAAALAGPFTSMTPAQALQAGALNARVCWAGGLRTIESVSEQRDCMVLLHAEFSEQGFLSWPREANFFKACGAGTYDRQLLQPFTLVWVSAKVTGQAEFVGTQIPVIEIDALYRGSDCLQGDTAPQCVHSYLQPQKKPQ